MSEKKDFNAEEFAHLVEDIQVSAGVWEPSKRFTVDEATENKVAETSETVKTETVAPEKPVKKKKKSKKEKKQYLHWYTKLLILVDLCAVICFVTAYGPYTQFRDWLVTTALSTANHRYFAYVLYSSDYVKEIVAANKTLEVDGESDANAIQFVEYEETDTYSSIYEEQVLKKDEGNDMYKIIELNEDGYKGYITVIYHPERLDLEMAKGKSGDTITTFAKRTGGIICTNAGPARRYSNGHLYAYSEIVYKSSVYFTTKKPGHMTGMTQDGVLVLCSKTAAEAVADGLKWGVCFSPWLIVNGVPSQFTGNGGYGVHPRTAIGQRKDGIVLLVTIDGRGAGGSSGISVPDLTDIFVRYGCYNAANLDGGGSTMLAVNGVLRNNPKGYNYSGERYVYNCLYYK